MTPSTSLNLAVGSSTEKGIVARIEGFAISHPLAFIFLLALVVRVFIAVVLTRYFSGTLLLDDTTYHQMAVDMAAGRTAHWDEFTNTLYWGTATFMVPVTFLYKVFGPQAIVAQLMIGIVGSLTALFVTRLAMEFLSVRWALAAGCFMALLPSQAFWSSMLLKDAFVWFVLSGLGLTIAVAARSGGRKLLMLMSIAGVLLIALSYLRLHTLVVASWALMIAMFFGIRAFRTLRVGSAVVVATLVPLIFGGIGAAGLSLATNAGSLEDRRFQNAVGANTAIVDATESVPPWQEVEQLEGEAARLEAAATTASPEEAEGFREEATELREQIIALEAQRAQFEGRPARPAETGPLDPDIAHLPRGLSVMLIEPFPLPYRGTIGLRLARLEALLWYPLLFLAGAGIVRAREHLRQLAFPLVAGVGIVVMYALTEGNIGTAHRHRGEFVWVIALLAALGLARLRGSSTRSTISEA